MRKTFKLDEFDCANCARKHEDAIKTIDGVDDARVNFLTQKLTLTADDDCFDDVRDRVIALVAKVEPDCEVILP